MLDSIDHRRLLDDHGPTVRRLLTGLERLTMGIACARYGLSRHDAEDVLLEVVRKLWDSDKAALRRWRGEGSLRTYLSSIVNSHCLMELRRRRRRPVEVGTERLDDYQSDAVVDRVEHEQLVERYRRAATGLDERDRRLIEMRFVEERGYDSITKELGMSHGAARKALHTALGRLRKRLRALAPELFPAERAT